MNDEPYLRRMVAERRQNFFDENGWPESIFEEGGSGSDNITDRAAVLSICGAIRRLMDCIEETALRDPALATRLRESLSRKNLASLDDSAFSADKIIFFLEAATREADASLNAATIFGAAVANSVLGHILGED